MVAIRYITSSKGARPMTDTKADYKFNPPAPSKVVTLAIEARDKMLAEARAEEREECCRDICWYCRKNWAYEVIGIAEYVHPDPNKNGRVIGCAATGIRQRAAKEHSPS
jgi:hypothetical protein